MAKILATRETVQTVTPSIERPELIPFPDHTQLPEEDGTFVKNFQEHPQANLLSDTIRPILRKLHPDGYFAIGQDCGIYWRETDPPEKGATSPDWFYVPNVPPLLDGRMRRSYVLWRELFSPLIVIEFVSETPGGERDTTPYVGKFWAYEKIIKPTYYAIYEAETPMLEVYHHVDGKLKPLRPNKRGHFPIPQLGVELGLWLGEYSNYTLPWLRWWDEDGNLLPTGEERAEQEAQRAEQEAQRAEQEAQRAEQEAQRAERLAAKLRAMGIDPDEVDQ